MKEKEPPPYQQWNMAVDMTGYGKRASAKDGTHILKRLRELYKTDFKRAFRHRMITARADTFTQLLEDWLHERTRLGV